jgi:hypothetical protein
MLHIVALLSLVASCRERGADTTVVALDTSSARDSLEVVSVQADSAAIAGTGRTSTSLATRADSVALLDARFQRERSSLNAEARALERADRRSAEYGRQFEAWRMRALVADSLRAARDRLLRDRTGPQHQP